MKRCAMVLMCGLAGIIVLSGCQEDPQPYQEPQESQQAQELAVPAPVQQAIQPPQEPQWQMLFDGTDTSAWRGINRPSFPEQGWSITDGQLVRDPASGGSRDIITLKEYGNFELELEFKMTERANSGIKYFVVEALSSGSGGLGLEYQILDDERHPDAKAGKNNNRTLASLYDLIPAREDKPANPIGEWNTARIVSRDMHVEHWLNGVKVLEFTRGGSAFREAVAGSKFRDNANFGMAEKGHILLQDHGDKVYFRNIRIRELDSQH